MKINFLHDVKETDKINQQCLVKMYHWDTCDSACPDQTAQSAAESLATKDYTGK